MQLLGKIFIGLQTVLSVGFLFFALAVTATHINWRDAVKNPKDGYEIRADNLRRGNEQLKTQLEDARTKNAQEQAARRVTLAALQTQLDSLKKDLAQKTTELNGMQAANTEMSQALAATQKELGRVTDENAAVKIQLNTVMDERNTNQRRVASLTDEVNEKKVLLTTLESKIRDLADSGTLAEARLANALSSLASNGILENPDDAPPVDLQGVVLAVGQAGLIEISLGSDDGIMEGHRMEVYRGGQYLGRIQIQRTKSHKAIGVILPGFNRGAIQQGDNVSSRLG